MRVNSLVKLEHEYAKEKGFWDEPMPFAAAIALIHSELSEALEEDRQGNPQMWYDKNGKPEGVAFELADAVLRIADLCGYLKIDLEKAIVEKMAYNAGRPPKHNKRY